MALKAKGKTRTGRINPLASTKSSLKVKWRINSPDHSNTEGIEEAEISRTKSAGERLRCAWPSDQKGSHLVKNCLRRIKINPGMALSFKALWIVSSEQESSNSLDDV